jgi:hypothetical protein
LATEQISRFSFNHYGAFRAAVLAHSILDGSGAMNAHIKPDNFIEPLMRATLLRKILRALIAIFSSPKGNQGGWEGGARGL